MRLPLAVATCLATLDGAYACSVDSMVGWTLIARKTIAGYIENGERKGDFEGCDFDRIIVTNDETAVRCTTYSYTYSYRPTAYMWANGSLVKTEGTDGCAKHQPNFQSKQFCRLMASPLHFIDWPALPRSNRFDGVSLNFDPV
jgi:hypothetical protein